MIVLLPCPVFFTDLSRLVFESKSARVLIDSFGVTKKKHILSLNFTTHEQETLKLKEIIEGCSEARIERQTHNSGTHFFELRRQELEMGGSKIYIVSIHDVTGIKEREEEMAVKKFKAVMFASMTHEIRTPLNAIINSCDVIFSKESNQDIIE